MAHQVLDVFDRLAPQYDEVPRQSWTRNGWGSRRLEFRQRLVAAADAAGEVMLRETATLWTARRPPCRRS